MRLSDLAPHKRKEMIEIALAAELRHLTGPASTAQIVDDIAATLGAVVADKAAIARVITAMAPAHPQAVRGSQFVRYGRTMQRWNWVPAALVKKGGPTP